MINEELMSSFLKYAGLPFISFAVVLCFVEFFWLEEKKADNFKLFASDLIILAVELSVNIIASFSFVNYGWFQKYSIFNFDINYLTFIASFLLYDLFFYFEHFLMHRWSFFWSLHYVHHSSSRFGLSIGFRLSWMRPVRRMFFMVPMVLIGFHPVLVFFSMSLINIWGFFVHTGTKIKFPKVLFFLMSPYLHSLHHEKRIQAVNLGGFFTIWDYLFKTIEINSLNELKYGVEGYVPTLNPFKNQFLEIYKFIRSKFLPTNGVQID